MNGITEENARFVSDCTVDSTEQKENLLREFLLNDAMDVEDDVQVNRNKFLYLYGDQNTGQLSILKTVAKEVFGDKWESKIYLRVDEGQRYPYKLHAHKVEASKKVIFVTHSRLSWAKWMELYPMMRTFTFVGMEHQPNADGLVTIRYEEYFTTNRKRKEDVAKDIKEILKEVCESMNVSENIHIVLKEKLMNRIRRDFVEQHNLFGSSEVGPAQALPS